MNSVVNAQRCGVQPVILSGGSGTRLWPVSRRAYPKQFIPLIGEESLFQQTLRRLDHPLFCNPSVLGNHEHRFIIAEQMRGLDITPEAIVLEPAARNTAPVALIASLMAVRKGDNALVLLLPSDHVIGDNEGFVASVLKGIEAAKKGKIITFGVRPDSPDTGYGYIEARDGAGDVLDVARFVEKPTSKKAESYLQAGNYFWNAGMFLFSAVSMIKAFERQQPAMLDICRQALGEADNDLDFVRLDAAAYVQCEDISLDYAIMEEADNVGCVPLTTSWSDLGSWTAVAEQASENKNGNAAHGDVMFYNSHGCYGHSTDGADLTFNGLDDVIAVVTKDAVLVSSKSGAQDIKKIVQKKRAKSCNTVNYHTRVHRPWGWYEGLEQGERFQVKCLMVKPGAQLSLQSHHHRAEHWVVVSGTARVTVGDEVALLTENESTFIPIGATHRLENPGQIPALLIEVQSGSYLGEDDIVRYDDRYGRNI
ncbi:MAG: mannose-1-phosphate guanylyltransferase/mannose-6-phosphate isomerase [Alphaproteobacteria bacterium]|nr:mannose-1-phosphate guanylyltransferase/mannose-6-phosphate isomerase [Alphaproteobacteria bacterium]